MLNSFVKKYEIYEYYSTVKFYLLGAEGESRKFYC